MAGSLVYLRHYLNLFGSTLAIIVLVIYVPRWVVAFSVIAIAWSIARLRRGPHS